MEMCIVQRHQAGPHSKDLGSVTLEAALLGLVGTLPNLVFRVDLIQRLSAQ